MGDSVLPCREPRQREKAVARASELLKRGGLVVFPTETVYGVGAMVSSDRGLERLRQLKSRTDEKPFTLHVPDVETVWAYLQKGVDPLLDRLIAKSMPGPITLVADVPEAVQHEKLKALGLAGSLAARLYHRQAIGIRCPDDSVAEAVLRSVPGPLVASSANFAAGREPFEAVDARKGLGDQVDLILDAGPTRYRQASTVVQVRDGQAVVLREGVYSQEDIDRLSRFTILFVCTGNTCRSPMAEAIARHEWAAELGVAPEELGKSGFEILSAGVSAMPGMPMSGGSDYALRQLDIPVHDHESQPLTPALLQQADVVYAMTRSHEMAARACGPGLADRVELVDPDGSDVDDPIGGDDELYLECAESIRRFIRRRMVQWH